MCVQAWRIRSTALTHQPLSQKQCVKQSFRVSYLPLNLGGGWGWFRAAAAGGPAEQPKFFFQLLSIDQFSYRIWCLGQIMYTFRGCESPDFCNCDSTFLSVNCCPVTPTGMKKKIHFFLVLKANQEMGDYYRDFTGGREQHYSKT